MVSRWKNPSYPSVSWGVSASGQHGLELMGHQQRAAHDVLGVARMDADAGDGDAFAADGLLGPGWG